MNISKAIALRQMSATDSNGKRKSFALEFITADRDKYRQRKRWLEKLATLDPKSSEHELLLDKIKHLDIGGKLISHHDCLLSQPRGIHAAALANKDSIRPSHSANRTRNIVLMPGNNIRKIHNSLIISFNNHDVFY